MKLAVSNIAWAPTDRIAAYALLSESGITGLEIAPALFLHTADDPFNPTRGELDAALSEIRCAGLKLFSMQSLLFGVAGAAVFEGLEALKRFEHAMIRAIRLAGRLGIPNLVFGSPKQRVIPGAMDRAEAEAHAAEVFRRLGDAAAAEGAVIAMEPNPEIYGTNFLNTFDETRRFVEAVDHPAVTLILDLGAMRINGEFAEIPAAIAAAGERLSHVHVSEPALAPAPAYIEDAASVLRALAAARYDRAVSIEMKTPEGGLDEVANAISRLVAARADTQSW
jgi:sugar phosphate isomerase/epimerase